MKNIIEPVGQVGVPISLEEQNFGAAGSKYVPPDLKI